MTGIAIELLWAPYDSGHRGVRMGAGPQALVRAGAASRLRERGHHVREHEVGPTSSWRAELRTAFELYRQIAVRATKALADERFPLLLAGNCGATVGLLAALQATHGDRSRKRVGLLWLDAHGDFNTPATDPRGFLDGQGLAMAVGRCWNALTATVPGFAAIPETRVLLVGARTFDEAEEAALRRSQVTWLPPALARHPDAVRAAAVDLAANTDVIHVHIDLDVHDPSIAPANSYAAPDGLTAAQVRDAVRLVAADHSIGSATLASYDPSFDPDGRLRDTALDLLGLLADEAALPHPAR